MSYRETPRIAAKDGRLDGVVDDANPRPRLRRFEFVHAERQLDIPRVVVAAALVLTAVVLLGYLGNQAVRSMITWLHQQPQYQVRFVDIRLQKEPPGWFLGGAQAFLHRFASTLVSRNIFRSWSLNQNASTATFAFFHG